jgi:hypothetical protein
LNASVYLTTESLKPIFQDQINQQVIEISGSTMNKMIGSLPAADQGWARSMAGALIQPSATLTQLTPQNDGFDTKLTLSMYPGDPKPIDAAMLVTFGVRDVSTIQVSAQPVPGSPELANGPLTTFTVPVGQLQSVNTSPGCGNMGLKVNIQMPVNFSIASNQSQNNQVALSSNQALADIQQPRVSYTTQNRAANTLDAYAEIPNSSLSALGSAIGTIKINSVLTAEKLSIGTQDNGLVIISQIYTQPLHVWVATATTPVQPSAENGQLVMHVPSPGTRVQAGPFFNFPNTSFDPKIEQMLNSNLGDALVGKFTVNGVSVGAGAGLSCADSSSLILQGTTSLG